MGLWRLRVQKFRRKINVENAYFCAFVPAKWSRLLYFFLNFMNKFICGLSFIPENSSSARSNRKKNFLGLEAERIDVNMVMLLLQLPLLLPLQLLLVQLLLGRSSV